MALDGSIPLKAYDAGEIQEKTQRNRLLGLQGDVAQNAMSQAPLENDLNKLKVLQAQNQAVAQKLQGITDQRGWDAGLSWAQQNGIDVSSLPRQYDPQVQQQLLMSSLSTAERLDMAFKQQQLQATQSERDYQRQKDSMDYGLRERELNAKRPPSLNGQNMTSLSGVVPGGPAPVPLLPVGAGSADMGLDPSLVGDLGPVVSPTQMSANLDPMTDTQTQANIAQGVPETAPVDNFARDAQGGYITETSGGKLTSGYAYGKDGTPMRIPGMEKALTSSQEKEIYDATDIITNSEGALEALTSAKSLLDRPEAERPYSGFGADARTGAARLPLIGGIVADKDRGAATTEYNTLITEQALSSLKATFGGNPTEGERQILLKLQAMSDYDPKEQKAILNRAIAAAERRSKFNQQKVKAIQGRDYNALTEAAVNSAKQPTSVEFLGFE